MKTMTTKPTAGAVRAAEKIIKQSIVVAKHYHDTAVAEYAAIIDRETNLAELVEALEHIVNTWRCEERNPSVTLNRYIGEAEQLLKRAALAKAGK